MHGEATTQPVHGFLTLHAARFADVLQHGVSLDELLTLCRNTNAAAAVVLMLAGLVFLLWGFYAFKTLTIVNAAALGSWVGYVVGQKAGAPLPAAAAGAFVAIALTWPMMKYAVGVMGGLIGMAVGMTVWRTAGLSPDYAAAGGGMGLIFFGMLSFILFRTSLMLMTSVQGAIMLCFGLLCTVYKLRLFDAKVLDAKLSTTNVAVPAVIAVAAVIGLLYQNNDTSPKAAEASAK